MNKPVLTTEQKLSKWATTLKVPEEEVKGIYQKYIDAGESEKKATSLTIGDLQSLYGSVLSDAPTFFVYVVDAPPVVDIIELMKLKAKRLFDNEDTHDQAIQDGIVTMDGTPLDTRQTQFGRPNPSYGIPLTGTSWQRTFSGIVSDNEDFDTVSYCELVIQNEEAKNMAEVQPFKFYKVRGNRQTKNPSRINLIKTSKFTEFDTTLTTAELANKLLTVPLSGLKAEYDQHFAGKKRVFYSFPIKGTVTQLFLESNYGNRQFVLTDEDEGTNVKCRIPETKPITFSRTDDIVAFVGLYADRQGKLVANVKNYMVV